MLKRSAVALAVLAASVGTARAQVKAGAETRVNNFTTGQQTFASATGEPDGDFIVTWRGSQVVGTDVFAQRFDRAGTQRGAEFLVNSYTTSYQQFLGRNAVAAARDGRFVVAWASYTQDGYSWGTFAQRYNADGTRAGGEFQVNTYTSGQEGGLGNFQTLGAGMNPKTGDFVVTWGRYTYAPGPIYSFDIKAQRYNAAGVPLGGEFQVSTPGVYSYGASVSVNSTGNFVIVWDTGGGADGSGVGVSAKRFDASGNAVGGEFQVNTYTTGNQGFLVVPPSVALGETGTFLITWESNGQDGNGFGPFGRVYDANGVPFGAEFQINTYTTGNQDFPRAAADEAGNFVVTWTGPDGIGAGASFGVFGQRLTATGARRGGEFQVNTYTTNYQGWPAIAGDAVGNFTIAWSGYNALGDPNFSITMQRYGGLFPNALIVDGAGNLVWEPGETVVVAPAWRNLNGTSQTFAGTLSNLTGPPGATYNITDATGDYGTVADGASAPCTDCYGVMVSNPATRPVQHWDATALENITPDSQGQKKPWTLHIGNSFTDVPSTTGFYRFIETILHKGITGGCGSTSYCPADPTARDQMAVFVLVAKEGAGYAPPACTTPIFNDVPASSTFCRFVEELARRGVVTGCGGGNYCPNDPVTREQMAIFVLRTLDPVLNPPACGTPVFNDVPASSPFCKWIEELARRGVVTGCGGGNYCPTQPVTREQVSVFLTVAFGLTLYGI